ncbi:MFS general substrate transporter [Melanomma pulvis-pyrius CBS 109.77]|uniref:MFS general substrate transporter n=1 Tax=Melanomma pulvis-pyrius CBS 109.77 TaxID=1314802 RepID=A0A6A6XTD4_9PLEO|nr:MFS general substrate transporter [Melanomma pulvis-pyrius CBS 109.77]
MPWSLPFAKSPQTFFEVIRRGSSDPCSGPYSDPYSEPNSPRITAIDSDLVFAREPMVAYPHPPSQATASSITRTTPHFDTPPCFIRKRRWYILVSFRIGVLFLNAFLAHFDNFILEYFKSKIAEDLHIQVGQYAQLSSYWTGFIYAISSMLIAWFADYATCRARTLALVSGLCGLCILSQGLVTNFKSLLVARVCMGIWQASVEALSISLISDMAPWPEVFLGSSVFYVANYITDATAGEIVRIFDVLGIKKWGDKMKCIGTVGMVFAAVVALVIPEPRRQKSLVRESTEEFGLCREKERRLGLAWRDVRKACVHMMRLRSLWVLVLSIGIRRLGEHFMTIHMPIYLRSIYPDVKELHNKYGLIIGTTRSTSVLVGGIITLIIWRTTTAWRWKSVPFWVATIGGMVSSIFLICAIFLRNDRRELIGLKVSYGNLAMALLTSETWFGVLSTVLISLLSPAYKTLGFSICSNIQWIIYAAGPEILRIGFGNKDLSGESYSHILPIALSVIVPVCYFWGGIGFLVAARLLRQDMEEPSVLHGDLSYGRKLRFVLASFILVVVVIVLLMLGTISRP